jgi:hypothetical protein
MDPAHRRCTFRPWLLVITTVPKASMSPFLEASGFSGALVPGMLTVVLWSRDRSLFGPTGRGLHPDPDRLIEQ